MKSFLNEVYKNVKAIGEVPMLVFGVWWVNKLWRSYKLSYFALNNGTYKNKCCFCRNLF